MRRRGKNAGPAVRAGARWGVGRSRCALACPARGGDSTRRAAACRHGSSGWRAGWAHVRLRSPRRRRCPPSPLFFRERAVSARHTERPSWWMDPGRPGPVCAPPCGMAVGRCRVRAEDSLPLATAPLSPRALALARTAAGARQTRARSARPTDLACPESRSCTARFRPAVGDPYCQSVHSNVGGVGFSAAVGGQEDQRRQRRVRCVFSKAAGGRRRAAGVGRGCWLAGRPTAQLPLPCLAPCGPRPRRTYCLSSERSSAGVRARGRACWGVLGRAAAVRCALLRRLQASECQPRSAADAASPSHLASPRLFPPPPLHPPALPSSGPRQLPPSGQLASAARCTPQPPRHLKGFDSPVAGSSPYIRGIAYTTDHLRDNSVTGDVLTGWPNSGPAPPPVHGSKANPSSAIPRQRPPTPLLPQKKKKKKLPSAAAARRQQHPTRPFPPAFFSSSLTGYIFPLPGHLRLVSTTIPALPDSLAPPRHQHRPLTLPLPRLQHHLTTARHGLRTTTLSSPAAAHHSQPEPCLHGLATRRLSWHAARLL